jgi:hypothetical protein
MTGWYPVRTEAQAAALSRFLDEPLDLTTYDYAVDYYQPLARRAQWVLPST